MEKIRLGNKATRLTRNDDTERQVIENLQRYLRRLSFEYPEITSPPIDGIFDTVTKRSLTDFQKKFGLGQTGVADKLTWDRLFAEYLAVTELEREKRTLDLFPAAPADYAVSLGETWLLVRVIQLLLMELSAAYDIFEDITESGVYDEETEKAIKRFQEINGLPPTGRVDAATWYRIVREYSNLSPELT